MKLGLVATIDILDLEWMLLFQNMFEINYSQLIQYEVLEKLVTFIHNVKQLKGGEPTFVAPGINMSIKLPF